MIFRVVNSAVDGAGHSIGITNDGQAYSWGSRKGLGQLGRKGRSSAILQVHTEQGVRFEQAYVGGNKQSGHSALVDTDGRLWMFGNDRWQQLGLGSSKGGAAGYTWKALWQERPVLNEWFHEVMPTGSTIRDMALGADHTVLLASNRRDVIVWGNGQHGELGLGRYKPFVSAPVRSKDLSLSETPTGTGSTKDIAAVCAIHHCSLTLDHEGNVVNKSGKCGLNTIRAGLEHCLLRARKARLIDTPAKTVATMDGTPTKDETKVSTTSDTTGSTT